VDNIKKLDEKRRRNQKRRLKKKREGNCGKRPGTGRGETEGHKERGK